MPSRACLVNASNGVAFALQLPRGLITTLKIRKTAHRPARSQDKPTHDIPDLECPPDPNSPREAGTRGTQRARRSRRSNPQMVILTPPPGPAGSLPTLSTTFSA